ncbi:amidohydrolase [Arthrobacter antibioticus]|uniref:amidohydrolase n=1 Tax=Arthrobacter sp. H35-MC1 TaxID=3046203 RepID=UPI0024B9567D|nr:amidohydrolase [Arthrobacter sp. H35-MC1]MDJ0315578.1 amidohydrolase [Arthrobacter sp. H35-MC1]
MLEQRLFVNGRFLTEPSNQTPGSSPTALLSHGEEIIALGTSEELRAHTVGAIETIDLAGATVIPGLTDAHIHTANLARELAAVDLRGAKDLEEALERIRTFAQPLPHDAWIFGGRWDFNAWTVPIQPTRQALDSVTGGRPAALPSVDGHTVWANTAALRAVGITAASCDPVGGEIERDASGEPTGILREAAHGPLEAIMHSSAAGDLTQQLKTAQDFLLSVGLTGIHDFDGEDCLAAYRTLEAAGDLQLRVHKAIPAVALDLAIAERRFTGAGTPWLRTGPVKLFSDGALGSHTCHVSEPFPGEDGNVGIAVTPFEELLRLVRRAASAGIAVATHAIGDRANHLVLNAYEDLTNHPVSATRQGAGAQPLRHRIEHTQHLLPGDVSRLARLGVIPSMQPTHCTSDYRLVTNLLADRKLASYAWRSLIDAGAIPAFGSDSPVEQPHPLHGIHAAVTRQDSNHLPQGGWQPSERVTVQEAIAGFTSGAAHASGEERLKGRLKAGMLADFTVLGEDPCRVSSSDIRDIPVEATVVGGRVRYRKSA